MLKLHGKLVNFLAICCCRKTTPGNCSFVGSLLNFHIKNNSEYTCLFFYQDSLKLKKETDFVPAVCLSDALCQC